MAVLSKALIKQINSLKIKKYREKHNLFVAEGRKMIDDLIQIDAPIKQIITSNQDYHHESIEIIHANASEIKKVSFLKTPGDTIAILKIPKYELAINKIQNELSLALDNIQDPGNMGTIIRIANWFGINNVLCSKSCADIYNPKVVQASMGAILGVKVHYIELEKAITQLKQLGEYNVYGTFMNGDNIYGKSLSNKGLIVMGSEGKGISQNLSKLIDHRLTIPSSTVSFKGTESLNVAVATGIVLSEFVGKRG